MIEPVVRWAWAAAAELEARPDLFVSSIDLDDLLGTGFRMAEAVEAAHSCFAAIRMWTYESHLMHVPRLVVQLRDSIGLNADPPSIDRLQADLHEHTPPGLYLSRRAAGLAFPDREEYVLPLSQDVHSPAAGAVHCHYSCSRSIELREPAGEYTRAVHFVYNRLAGSDSPDRLVWF